MSNEMDVISINGVPNLVNEHRIEQRMKEESVRAYERQLNFSSEVANGKN